MRTPVPLERRAEDRDDRVALGGRQLDPRLIGPRADDDLGAPLHRGAGENRLRLDHVEHGEKPRDEDGEEDGRPPRESEDARPSLWIRAGSTARRASSPCVSSRGSAVMTFSLRVVFASSLILPEVYLWWHTGLQSIAVGDMKKAEPTQRRGGRSASVSA